MALTIMFIVNISPPPLWVYKWLHTNVHLWQLASSWLLRYLGYFDATPPLLKWLTLDRSEYQRSWMLTSTSVRLQILPQWSFLGFYVLRRPRVESKIESLRAHVANHSCHTSSPQAHHHPWTSVSEDTLESLNLISRSFWSCKMAPTTC